MERRRSGQGKGITYNVINTHNLSIKRLKSAIRESENAIENLWRGIECGQGVEMLMERINKRQDELDDLKAQLAVEENKKVYLSEAQIYAFLDYVSKTVYDDVNKKRAIINIFVHSVYLYDDHFNIVFNTSKKPVSKDNIPYEDIQAVLNAEDKPVCEGSSLQTSVPPLKSRGYQPVFSAFYVTSKVEMRGIEGDRAVVVVRFARRERSGMTTPLLTL